MIIFFIKSVLASYYAVEWAPSYFSYLSFAAIVSILLTACVYCYIAVRNTGWAGLEPTTIG